MVELIAIGEGAILLALGVGAFWLKNYLPTYLTEKGKNLATKEDIAGITRQIEHVRSEYAIELEKLRGDLRLAEIRFSRLHDMRAKAIVGLYRRLVRTEELFQQMAGGLIVSATMSTEEVEVRATKAANDLIVYYSDRRLLFDPEFVVAFEELRMTMVQSYYRITLDRKLDLARMEREERREVIERRRAGEEEIRTRIPSLVADLERRMRKMLEGETA